MAGSSSERAIRDAVADFARRNLPNARIIHELVVGACRADLAAVQPDRVTLFEIKSEKDTLDRLEKQARTFLDASHETVIVAHEKWFVARGSWEVFLGPSVHANIWRFPEPEEAGKWVPHKWAFKKPDIRQPAPRAFLDLMWRAEMVAEAEWHFLPATRRMTMEAIKSEMAFGMTGSEIAEAVCRQLRARPFDEADPPIIDGAAANTKREMWR